MAGNVEFSIVVDARQAITYLERESASLESHMNSLLVRGANATKDEMKVVAPVGVAGLAGAGLRGSIGIRYDVTPGPGVSSALVGPNTDESNIASYAAAVETGSRPHMPPTDPDGALAQWCELKGLPLWPVALSIKRKGTQAHPYAQPTYETMRPLVEALFDNGIREFVLTGGE